MKIKFELELDANDVIEKNCDYETGDEYYELKDNDDIVENIVKEVEQKIVSDIRYSNNGIYEKIIKQVIDNNKEEIVKAVINKISKSITNTKAIKDFKKSLEVEND